MAGIDEVKKELEALMESVSKMEQGGDLDGLICGRLDEINRIIYEAALCRREQATADEAAFSPSSMPEVRSRRRAQEGSPGAEDQDDEG